MILMVCQFKGVNLTWVGKQHEYLLDALNDQTKGITFQSKSSKLTHSKHLQKLPSS